MKRIFVTIFVAVLSSGLFAQISAYEYLYTAPAIPENLCHTKGPQQEAYLKTIIDLSDSIKKDIQNRILEAYEYTENHKEEMQAGILRTAGFSETDIQRISGGKDMTDAEKDELRNQLMQKKTDITMNEAINLKYRSKEERQTWAVGYGAEQMTVPLANKQLPNELNENITTNKLLSEHSALRQNINEQEKALQELYESIDSVTTVDRIKLEKELKPLYEELKSINLGEGSSQADIELTNRVTKEIQALQERYCEKITPLLTNFLLQCRDSTEKSLPDYDRLEEIQYEVVAEQTGTEIMKAGRGVYSLQAVVSYLGYLAEVFIYKQ